MNTIAHDATQSPTNTDMKKRFFDMTDDEIEKKARLTPGEKTAVYNFLVAAKALPKSICIEVDDDWEEEGNLRVSKRITRGSCRQVASLRKKSLHFRRTHKLMDAENKFPESTNERPRRSMERLVLPAITPRETFEHATWKYANEKYPQSRPSILFDAGKLGICLLEWSGSCGGRWRNVWYDRLHSLPNDERIRAGKEHE